MFLSLVFVLLFYSFVYRFLSTSLKSPRTPRSRSSLRTVILDRNDSSNASFVVRDCFRASTNRDVKTPNLCPAPEAPTRDSKVVCNLQ